MKVIDHFNKVVQSFNDCNILDAEANARMIFENILKKKYANLVIENGHISQEYQQTILNAVKQRLYGIPVAYIFQKANFYGRDFYINENCLIPRFDSEILIEKLLQITNTTKNHKEKIIICDLCSGTGCLGITLAMELRRFFQEEIVINFVDIDQQTIKVAVNNALLLTDNKISFNTFNFDIKEINNFENFQKCDILISNPPYISSGDIAKISKDVYDFEPIIALDGGKDGLDFYRSILSIMNKICYKDCVIGLEFGDKQEDAMKTFFGKNINFAIKNDLSNKPRCCFFSLS